MLALVRISLDIEYSKNGITADIKVGFIKFRLFPQKEKAKVKKVKKPEKKPEAQAASATKSGGKLSEFKPYLELITKALSDFKRKLKVDELTVHFAAGGENPVAVAIAYGGVTAAMGMIVPILEQNLVIKNRDFETSLSFEIKEPYIYVRAKITSAVWELILIGIPLLRGYMKTRDMRKEEK